MILNKGRCNQNGIKIKINVYTLLSTGELSDRLVDSFIERMKEKEKDSSKLKEENYRAPLSDCNAPTMKTSNSQDKTNVSDTPSLTFGEQQAEPDMNPTTSVVTKRGNAAPGPKRSRMF